MPTDDSRVNLSLKRFLSNNRLDANFFTYLSNEQKEIASSIFTQSGIFTFPMSITPDYGNSTFTLGPNPSKAIDNQGNVFLLTSSDHLEDISFENNTGDDYWIGLYYIEIPDGVYDNPRTGLPEYDKYKNSIGMKDAPDLVTDNGNGTITFRVNSVLQSSVDHTDRKVMVWLRNPLSGDSSVAIETLDVSYSSPNNEITTVSIFGQGSVSTVTTDYYVASIGPVVYNAGANPTANPFSDNYCVVGYITGGSPGSYSVDDQIDLSGGGGHTLQKAYTGSGSGAGKTIVVNNEAIELRQENSSDGDKDVGNSPLRIRKDITTALPDNGFENEIGIDIANRFNVESGILIRNSLSDRSGSDELRVEEAIDILSASDRVDFTRVGVNLTPFGTVGYLNTLDLHEDLVEITGSSLGNDGIYKIYGRSTAFIYVKTLSGAAVVFAIESGLTARLFRPTVKIGYEAGGIQINSLTAFASESPAYDSTGGNSRCTPLMISYSLGAPDDFELFSVNNGDSTTVFSITELSTFINKLYVDDNITTNSGNVVITDGNLDVDGTPPTTGNITCEGNITCQGNYSGSGNITTSVGIIRTNDGSLFIYDTSGGNGNITCDGFISAGGDISTSNGDVGTSSGDIATLDGNIATVDGNITAGGTPSATGNITSVGDINCGVDYNYSSAKTLYRTFEPTEGVSLTTDWYYSETVGQAISTTSDAEFFVPLNLPVSSVITVVKVLAGANSVGDTLTIKLYRHEYDWSSGTKTVYEDDSATCSGNGDDVVIRSLNPSVGNEEVTINRGFVVGFFTDSSVANINRCAGVRVEFEQTVIYP